VENDGYRTGDCPGTSFFAQAVIVNAVLKWFSTASFGENPIKTLSLYSADKLNKIGKIPQYFNKNINRRLVANVTIKYDIDMIFGSVHEVIHLARMIIWAKMRYFNEFEWEE